MDFYLRFSGVVRRLLDFQMVGDTRPSGGCNESVLDSVWREGTFGKLIRIRAVLDFAVENRFVSELF